MPVPALAASLFGLASLLVAWASGGLSASLINPDEGGHYVNALFLGDWIRAGFPAPMAFAQDYYAHFPRLSIGHWPPGWYMLEAPVFALLRPSPLGALAISAFVAGLPAATAVWAFERMGKLRLGLALATVYLLLPLTVDAARHLWLDQPVTLVVAIAAIAWARASERPGWGRFLLFALLAAAAPLVKGNGALIALVPAIDIALTGRWRLLRHPALWVAALVAMALVGPWYWIATSISSAAFIYKPGLEYAALALAGNARAIGATLGGGAVLALLGALSAFRDAPEAEQRMARLAVAVVAATLMFQSIVPAAIEPRYVTPLLPWLVVLAGIGMVRLWRIGRPGIAAAGVLATTAALTILVALFTLPPKPDIGAPAIGAEMARAGGLWLVDGRAGGEGALIAAAAHADGGAKRLWVSRASQWLSTSDFMGNAYRLTAADPAAARAVLDRLGAAGAVSVAERDRPAYPHSGVLREAVAEGYVVSSQPFAAGEGSVLVARRIAPAQPNIALVEQNGGSANVGKMEKALR